MDDNERCSRLYARARAHERRHRAGCSTCQRGAECSALAESSEMSDAIESKVELVAERLGSVQTPLDVGSLLDALRARGVVDEDALWLRVQARESTAIEMACEVVARIEGRAVVMREAVQRERWGG